MTQNQINAIVKALTAKGIQLEQGLSNDEVIQIEQKFNIKFPPDLKAFLQTVLPVDFEDDDSDLSEEELLNFVPSGYGWVNWRLGLHSEKESHIIQERLDFILEGILFGVECRDFWWHNWGEKPDDLNKCFEIVKVHYQTYPQMIPVFMHRFIPSTPNEMGNPVFSINSTDIIYYGNDLASYLSCEFNFKLSKEFIIPKEPKRIPFWSDVIDYLDTPL